MAKNKGESGKFNVVPGDRSKLEQKVLKKLIDPNSTSEDMDNAVASLRPMGELKLVSGLGDEMPEDKG